MHTNSDAEGERANSDQHGMMTSTKHPHHVLFYLQYAHFEFKKLKPMTLFRLISHFLTCADQSCDKDNLRLRGRHVYQVHESRVHRDEE